MEAIRATPREGAGAPRCAWCHDGLGEQPPLVCPGCGTRLHRACAQPVCPTLGCGQRSPQARRRSVTVSQRGAGLERWAALARPALRVLAPVAGFLVAVVVPLLCLLVNTALRSGLAPRWRQDPFWSWVHQLYHPDVQRWTYPFLAFSMAAWVAAVVFRRRARWIELGLGSGVALAGLYALLYARFLGLGREGPGELLAGLLFFSPMLAALVAYGWAFRRYRAGAAAPAPEPQAETADARLWGVWALLFGGAAVGMVRTMNALYAALPLQQPYDHCFLASAAARSDPRLTGARLVRFGDGRVRPITWQLCTFKAGELLLLALAPGVHARLRAVYDRLGPPLAARVGPRTATLAWAALLPAQLCVRVGLGLVLRDGRGLIARVYPRARP